MGNVGCFFSILSYFSTTSSSVLCFGLRLFFFSFFFFFLPRNWNGNAGNSISIATNISFQLTVYYLLCPRQKLGVVRSLRLLLFCYFFFVLFLSSWAFFPFFFSSIVSLLFVCGRLMTVSVASLARVLYRIVEDLASSIGKRSLAL